MLLRNITVKGYENEEFGAAPVVILTINGTLVQEELQEILTPIRKAFNELGQSMTFDVSYRDCDL